MNRLPQVLQNEIWEYVRGDRVYWRQQFQKVANHMEDIGHHAACEIAFGRDTRHRSVVMLHLHKRPIFVWCVTAEICRAVGDPPGNRLAYIDKWNHYVLYHHGGKIPRGQKCSREDCPFGS